MLNHEQRHLVFIIRHDEEELERTENRAQRGPVRLNAAHFFIIMRHGGAPLKDLFITRHRATH